MAKEYDVSFMTSRRVVELLNSLGVTKSVNGIGTQVICSGPDIGKLQQPALLKNFDIFFQCIQIAELITNNVFSHVFSTMSQSEKASLLAELRKQISEGNLSKIIFISLSRLVGIFPLQCLSEICSKLYELLLWGYPFIRLQRLDGAAQRNAAMLVEGLEKENASIYSRGMNNLLNEMSHIVKAALTGASTGA